MLNIIQLYVHMDMYLNVYMDIGVYMYTHTEYIYICTHIHMLAY